jgi:formate/nitrite transporter FocA (FNT family)
VFRLDRTLPGLLATGLVGGADVSAGVFALFIVKEETGSIILASLAFSIGFIALTLAGSELFTENFLVPIAAVAARQSTVGKVGRLWAGTAFTNLIGGWLIMGLVISGFPRLGPTAVEVARKYPEIGIGWRSFAGALLGGAVITLMTWMERSTEDVVGKLAAAISAAFLLAAAPLNHVIVVSLEMFGALQHGAPFGYADWASVAAWYALGNMIGGVMMVAGLRLVQVGRDRLEAERNNG